MGVYCDEDPFLMAIICGTDYSDTAMRKVYHFGEWARLKSMGLPTTGVRVTNNAAGTEGYIKDSDMMNLIAGTMIHPDWMKDGKTA